MATDQSKVTCLICGETVADPYWTWTGAQVCSREHFYEAIQRAQASCKVCGTDTSKLWAFNAHNGRVCSESCFLEGYPHLYEAEQIQMEQAMQQAVSLGARYRAVNPMGGAVRAFFELPSLTSIEAPGMDEVAVAQAKEFLDGD